MRLPGGLPITTTINDNIEARVQFKAIFDATYTDASVETLKNKQGQIPFNYNDCPDLNPGNRTLNTLENYEYTWEKYK